MKIRLVEFDDLIVSLEEDLLLGPDKGPRSLEVQVRLSSDLISSLGCAEGAVNQLLDGVCAIRDFTIQS